MTKESRRYSELAGYANARGYADLKRDTVQYWTRRGLVPQAGVEHVGFGVRVRTESIWTGRVLLRACQYRYDERIRDISQVGVLVWLERLPVSEDLVRAGLRVYANAGPRLLELVSRGSDLADAPMSEVIGAAADKLVYDRGFGEGLPEASAVPRPDRAVGVADLLGILLLDQATSSEELAKLGPLYGLDGDEFATGIVAIRHLLTPSALDERVTDASSEELRAAREHALAALADAGAVPPMMRIVTVLGYLAIGGAAHSG